MIQRYNSVSGASLRDSEDGNYIRYTDHLAEIAMKDKDIQETVKYCGKCDKVHAPSDECVPIRKKLCRGCWWTVDKPNGKECRHDT